MPFQPFGYRFEIRAPMSVDKAKDAIRARKKPWLDMRSGARGWIAGPFICLWFSAFDKNGPMLFALIRDDGSGTRILGRAGSDLNGVLMFLLLVPLMILLLFAMLSEGTATPRQLVVFGLLAVVGTAMMLWSAHKDRRSAEPLVRFLDDTISPSRQSRRTKSAKVGFPRGLQLDIGGERVGGPVTAEAVHNALLDIGNHDFVILEASPISFIQSAGRDGGYIIELRDAAGLKRALPDRSGEMFTFEEALEAFMAFGSGAAMPQRFRWESSPS